MAGLQLVRRVFNSDATSIILGGNAVGFLFAVLNGFYWNRRWTFRRHGEPGAGGEFVRFAAVSVVGLTLNTALLYLFYDRLRLFRDLPHPPLLNQLLTIAIVVFWNFTANTKWSFASRKPDPPV